MPKIKKMARQGRKETLQQLVAGMTVDERALVSALIGAIEATRGMPLLDCVPDRTVHAS